jgi:nitronate monooxygenase
MAHWPDDRIQRLFNIKLPILQAPMAGSSTTEMAIAVAVAGGLGSLPSAQMTPAQLTEALIKFRKATSAPVNVNFFCHTPAGNDPLVDRQWRKRLEPYYIQFGIDLEVQVASANRVPFDDAYCSVVEALRPEVVSFHFGLPSYLLLDRVRGAGAKIISSATTVREAVWLEAHGCDAVIAMGVEAGGHRGNFLTDDMSAQVGTMSLLPQVVDAVDVPVIAAGGIADGRGIVAAFSLGAAAVQIGTAYLFSPEAKVSKIHREALENTSDDGTAVTNVFTGRPARGVLNRLIREIGPLSPSAPAFPFAGGGLAPLRAKAEAMGSGDFTNLWSGQSARLSPRLPSGQLTERLAADALSHFSRLAASTQ